MPQINLMKSLDLVKEESEPELCSDYLKILSATDDNSENCFDDYVDIILNWYEDWFKLKGSNVKNTTLNLREVLNRCNIDEIESILSLET